MKTWEIALLSLIFLGQGTTFSKKCLSTIKGFPIVVECPCACASEYRDKKGKCSVCRHREFPVFPKEKEEASTEVRINVR